MLARRCAARLQLAQRNAARRGRQWSSAGGGGGESGGAYGSLRAAQRRVRLVALEDGANAAPGDASVQARHVAGTMTRR